MHFSEFNKMQNTPHLYLKCIIEIERESLNLHDPPLCEPPAFDNDAMFDLDVGIILLAADLAGGNEAHDASVLL